MASYVEELPQDKSALLSAALKPQPPLEPETALTVPHGGYQPPMISPAMQMNQQLWVDRVQHDYLLSLSKRAGFIPQQPIYDMPATVSSLLFSTTDTYSLSKIGGLLERSWPWLKQNTGLEGAFSAAYARALAIPDYTLRDRAVRMVQSMISTAHPLPQPEALGPAGQAPLSAAIAAGKLPAPPTDYLARPFDRYLAFDFEGEHVNLVLRDDQSGQPASLEVQSGSAPHARDVATVIQYLLRSDVTPNIQPAGGEAPGARLLGLIGGGFDTVGASPHGLASLVGKGLEAIPGGHVVHVVAQGVGKGVHYVVVVPLKAQFKAVGYGASRGSDVVLGSVAGAAAELGAVLGLKNAKGEKTPVVGAGDFLHRFVWPDKPGSGLGAVWNYGHGVNPDDPSYAVNEEIGNAIGSWIILGKIGGITSGIKAGLEGPALGAQASERFGLVGGFLHDFVSDGGPLRRTDIPGQGWLRTRGGQAFTDTIERITNDPNIPSKAGRIQAELGLPEPVAEQLARYRTKPEIQRAFLDSVSGHGDTQLTSALKIERGDITAGLDSMAALDPVERSTLLARKMALDDMLAHPAPREPVWQWPKPSLARRIVTDTPKNGLENALATIYDPSIVWPHFPGVLNVSRAFDTLGSTKVWNWLKDDAPPDAKSQNAQTLRTYFKRAGVPEASIERAVSGMESVLTDQDFYEWAKSIGLSLSGEGRAIYPGFRQRFGAVWDREASEQHRLAVETQPVIDGNRVYSYGGILRNRVLDPATGEWQWHDLPGISTEMADHFYLPGMERLRRATSTVQAMLEAGAQRGGGLGWVSTKVEKLSAISDVATAVFKPIILTARVPALILRTQLEQFLRNEAYGYKGLVVHPGQLDIPLPFGDEGLTLTFGRDLFYRGIRLPEDRTSLGSLIHTTMDRPGTRKWTEYSLWRTGTDGTLIPEPNIDGWRNGLAFKMAQSHLAPEVRMLIARNMDVEGWLKWLKSDDMRALSTRSRYDPLLLREDVAAGDTLLSGDLDARYRAWGEHLKQAIEQLTGGRDDLKQALLTGRWKVFRPGRRVTRAVFGRSQGPMEVAGFSDREMMLAHQFDLADSSLSSALATGDAMEIRAALTERDRLKVAMKMERQKAKGQWTHINLGDQDRMGRALQQEANFGQYRPPQRIAGYEYSPDNAMGARAAVTTLSNRIYRWGGFPISWAGASDAALTRGSLYYQIARDVQDQLGGMGWSKEAALAHAQTRAARLTSDMMYDLAARTSAQRFMRNTSYFLPAYQELATTWLIKIPSQYYWPIGAGILYNRFSDIHTIFKDLGVIKTDSNGDEVVPLPGMARLLAKLGHTPQGRIATALIAGYGTGGPIGAAILAANEERLKALSTLDPKVVRDMISFKARGLNLLTQGWPSLSTQDAALVNYLAKHHPAVAALANTLEQYGTETTVFPAAWNYWYEGLTGDASHLEILSPAHQDQLHDQAYDDAIKQAWAITGPPPRTKDFGITGKIPTTPAENLRLAKAQQALSDATDVWRSKMMTEAGQIYRGWQMVRAMGSTFSISALHITDTYAADAAKFYKGLFDKEPTKGTPAHDVWAQKISDWVNNYASDHPGSYAYFVGKSLLGQSVNAPITASASDMTSFERYYADLASGAKRVATPDEFLNKVFYNEAKRWNSAQRQQELDAVATTPDGLLRNGFARHEITDDQNGQWLAWKATFPEVAGEQDAQLRKWAVQHNVTFSSAQTDQVFQAGVLLRQLAQSQGTGGSDQVDWRKAAGQLLGLWYDQASQFFGAPRTPVAKGLAWYASEVLDPYLKETGPLYDAANAAVAEGRDPSGIYERIRRINNDWAGKNLSHGGANYPTPEEVFFANLSPDQRQVKVLSWASRPPSWLTTYQRDQAGYHSPPGADAFFSWKVAEDQSFARSTAGLSHNTNDYKAAKTRLLAFEAQRARAAGVLNLFTLDAYGTPADRLMQSGQITDPTFLALSRRARDLAAQIRQAGNSPAGFSADWSDRKVALFNAIRNASTQNGTFRDLMAQLSTVIQVRKHIATGALLYNALFFGGFDPRELPPGLQLAPKQTQEQQGAGGSLIGPPVGG